MKPKNLLKTPKTIYQEFKNRRFLEAAGATIDGPPDAAVRIFWQQIFALEH